MPNWKKVITSGSAAVLNTVTATGNISSSADFITTETGSFGHVIGQTNADTSVLQSTLTTQLNSSVGTIDNGNSFPIGTSIESLLRSMLIDYIPMSISSFSIDGFSLRHEVGMAETVTTGQVTTGSDSNNQGASSTALTITNNTLGSNTFGNYSLTGIGDDSIDFDDIITGKDTAGTITITFTCTPQEGSNQTLTDKKYMFYPIFCGGSTINADASNLSANIDTIIGDISGSLVEAETYMYTITNSPFVAQTYLGGSSSPSTSTFTDLTFNVPTSATETGKYTYIVYPATAFGDLSKCDLVNVGDLLGGGDVVKIGDADHNRFTNIGYRVYKSNLPAAFVDGQQLTVSS